MTIERSRGVRDPRWGILLMRPLLATFLLIAVLATGALVAVDLVMLLARPGGQQPHLTAPDASSDEVQLIHAYYEVANQLMAGAGDQALSTVAAPRIELHQNRLAPQVGSQQVAAHFAALSRTGLLRFQITRIVSDGLGYLVLVDVAHARASDSVSGERDPDERWTTTDRMTIKGGLIDGYWPGALPLLALPPLAHVRLEGIQPDSISALSRLELAPGTVMRALNIPAQQLLIVESGEISLESQESLRVSHGGAPWRAEQSGADPTEQRILAPGDAVLAPSGGLHFSNRRPEPASLLSVLIVSEGDLYGPKYALSGDFLVAVAMHDPKRLASPYSWASGVTSTPLAVASLPDAATILDVSGRTISLAPGQQCAACASSATAFAIVAAGFLETALADASGVTATPPPSARLLWPGDATTLDRDSPLSLKNAGPSELTLSLIELVSGGTPAGPPAP